MFFIAREHDGVIGAKITSPWGEMIFRCPPFLKVTSQPIFLSLVVTCCISLFTDKSLLVGVPSKGTV